MSGKINALLALPYFQITTGTAATRAVYAAPVAQLLDDFQRKRTDVATPYIKRHPPRAQGVVGAVHIGRDAIHWTLSHSQTRKGFA